MRVAALFLLTITLTMPGRASAQDWIEFASREDQFTCNFPGQPTVTTGEWKSEYGATLPTRIYSATQGASKYTVTVVDYSLSETILTEKAKSCPAGAETCIGLADTGIGYWKNDVRGAITYATWGLMQKAEKSTHLMWNFMEMVQGNQLQLTNKDGSRTFASIYMHENKLLIMEGTVPAGYPEPGLFQQSLGWLDKNGTGIRYSWLYVNDPDVPKPPIRRRTAPNQDQGRIDAPAAAANR